MPLVARRRQSGPSQHVLDWLDARSVAYQVRHHQSTATARATAYECGVQPNQYAKVVGVEATDGRRAMLVVGASDYVDLKRAAWALSVHRVRLLTEEELAAFAPECEEGALPAIPLSGPLPICADSSLRESARITFPAGSHRHTVTMQRAAWERAAGIEYYPLAESRPMRPERVEWY